MYINTVHFFSKPWGGGGGENNPMGSLVSDQCYFYAKYDKNASTSIGVNSRSSTNKVYQAKKFHNIDYLFDKHR